MPMGRPLDRAALTCAGIYGETGAGIVFLRPVGKVYLFTGPEPPTPRRCCHLPLGRPTVAR